MSMSDKLRDLRRKQLKNLKVIILDEISLIKADMLYQIHFRLMEIMQNKRDFGNVSILALGDIMQIKPPLGTMIYACPINEKCACLYQMPNGNLWEKFQVICLKSNHRQGESGDYANLLNRLRTGEQTDEDVSLLNTRVFPRNSSLIPEDALLITGENKIVNDVNLKKLNELQGELFEIETVVHSKTRGKFKPVVDKAGQIKNTPLQNILRIKRNARIMLTSNIDVCDNLSNGQLGEIVDLIFNEKAELSQILVQFDKKEVGTEHRKKNNASNKYRGQNLTCITKIEFEYKLKEGSASTATASNFPLKLAWATTCHKIQVDSFFNLLKK